MAWRVLAAMALGFALTPLSAWASPSPLSASWRPWFEALIAERLAACPRERTTTFHFSQSGSDTTGDGTIERPFRSLAQARELASVYVDGDVAFLFKRGDVWRETIGIWTRAPNVTIADYGDATLPKPVFTPFQQVGLEGWQPTLENPFIWWRRETELVTWVRVSDDLNAPMSRENTLESLIRTENSWQLDRVRGRLYVHLPHVRGVREETTEQEARLRARSILERVEIVRPTGAGIIASGDGSRLENLVAIGWGMQQNVPSQEHGIEARCVDNDRVVVIGCESYYGSSHALVHLAAGARGGVATFVDCKAGLTMYNVANETIFNSFSLFGDQDVIFYGCEAVAGTLPSVEWNWRQSSVFGRRGKGFFAHTGGDDAPPRRVMFVDSRFGTGPFACSTPSHIEDLPRVDRIEDARGLIVGEWFVGGLGVGTNFPVAPRDAARINGRYLNMTLARGTSLASWDQRGWIVNCVFEIDLANQNPAPFSLFNGLPGNTSLVNIWHSAFHVRTAPGVLFRFDYDEPAQSEGSSLVNTLLSHTGQGSASVNLGTATTRVRGNAYFGFDAGSSAADPRAVLLNTARGAGAPIGCTDQLVCAAAEIPGGAVLEFDQQGPVVERRTIGAREPAPCDDFDSSGVVDLFDYLGFVAAFAADEPAADFDGGGTVDFFDYLGFIQRWGSGCGE
ncbi:MAG: GC-type dockerin domain-anchored protein [Planctomycetota bacterium]|nr:GC-type dockerin domain-anchored protein [Planctomycetota bacterium]